MSATLAAQIASKVRCIIDTPINISDNAAQLLTKDIYNGMILTKCDMPRFITYLKGCQHEVVIYYEGKLIK
jgi:hypothetical protein